jgi:hypothetical protein
LVDQFGNDREKQIQELYLRALARPPTGQEIKLATSEIDALTRQWMTHLKNEKNDAPIKSTAEWKALSDFCQTMLSSAEFLYVD